MVAKGARPGQGGEYRVHPLATSRSPADRIAPVWLAAMPKPLSLNNVGADQPDSFCFSSRDANIGVQTS